MLTLLSEMVNMPNTKPAKHQHVSFVILEHVTRLLLAFSSKHGCAECRLQPLTAAMTAGPVIGHDDEQLDFGAFHATNYFKYDLLELSQ